MNEDKLMKVFGAVVATWMVIAAFMALFLIVISTIQFPPIVFIYIIVVAIFYYFYKHGTPFD